MNVREWMTKEECALLDKLKMEILNAVTVTDLLFYKEEMDRIMDGAKKRGRLLEKISVNG
ncbi:ABC-type ATPase with predicted acetyltransferase domain [Bacillus fengqiuensis]|nr:ABC-type ATPase with predicted acetyltransferase domain [Bacillus fengqiuensis]